MKRTYKHLFLFIILSSCQSNRPIVHQLPTPPSPSVIKPHLVGTKTAPSPTKEWVVVSKPSHPTGPTYLTQKGIPLAIEANSLQGCLLWKDGTRHCFGMDPKEMNWEEDPKTPKFKSTMESQNEDLNYKVKESFPSNWDRNFDQQKFPRLGSTDCFRKPKGPLICSDWNFNYENRIVSIKWEKHDQFKGAKQFSFASAEYFRNRTYCMVDNVGGVWCQGSNQQGNVGNNTCSHVSRPHHIPIAQPATKVIASNGWTCALLKDKTVNCWGYCSMFDGIKGYGSDVTPFYYDQCTNGDPAFRSSPYATPMYLNDDGMRGEKEFEGECPGSFEPRKVPRLKNIVELTRGSSHFCALDQKHRVWCWGEILGNKDQKKKNFVPSVYLEDAVLLSKSHEGNYTCAVTSSKKLYCWGKDLPPWRRSDPNVFLTPQEIRWAAPTPSKGKSQ
jgi:hypothetical protein